MEVATLIFSYDNTRFVEVLDSSRGSTIGKMTKKRIYNGLSRTDTKMQRKFNFISAILFDREFYFCDKKLEIILSIAS